MMTTETDARKNRPTTPCLFAFPQHLQIKRMQIIQAVQHEKQRLADQEHAKNLKAHAHETAPTAS
jgi:hypothetical protein